MGCYLVQKYQFSPSRAIHHTWQIHKYIDVATHLIVTPTHRVGRGRQVIAVDRDSEHSIELHSHLIEDCISIAESTEDPLDESFESFWPLKSFLSSIYFLNGNTTTKIFTSTIQAFSTLNTSKFPSTVSENGFKHCIGIPKSNGRPRRHPEFLQWLLSREELPLFNII